MLINLEIVAAALGAVRTRLGKKLGFNWMNRNSISCGLWIGRCLNMMKKLVAMFLLIIHLHNQKQRMWTAFGTDPASVYAEAYDVVLNGYELGGGSLQMHTRELQEKMF